MRIVFRDLPDLIDNEVRILVGTWKYVLPSWVRTLVVSFDENDLDDYATCNPIYEQREAELTLHPLFLHLDADDRLDTLLHEFAHILTAPLDALFESMAGVNLKGQERVRAAEAHRRESEGVVTDIAAALRAAP